MHRILLQILASNLNLDILDMMILYRTVRGTLLENEEQFHHITSLIRVCSCVLHRRCPRHQSRHMAGCRLR